jgi:hypothetical protein
MPIDIYNKKTSERLEWLCDDSWELPNQIDALESWLRKKGKELERNKYVADIGFTIRTGAAGGGGVLSSKSMEIMGKIGMDIYFSEYG